jgi:hypothetical protein
MNPGLLSTERLRLQRVRGALPFLWGILALYGVGVAMKVRTVLRIADASGMNMSEVMTLLSMDEATRLSKTFSGHEVVLVHYAISAFVGLGAFSLALLALILRTRSLRREMALLARLEELEKGGP